MIGVLEARDEAIDGCVGACCLGAGKGVAHLRVILVLTLIAAALHADHWKPLNNAASMILIHHAAILFAYQIVPNNIMKEPSIIRHLPLALILHLIVAGWYGLIVHNIQLAIVERQLVRHRSRWSLQQLLRGCILLVVAEVSQGP